MEDKGITSSFENPEDITLTLTRQDECIVRQQPVRAITLQTNTGALGVRPGHEYKIAKLVPGVLAIQQTESSAPESYFTSGGFAQINSDGQVDVNTVECVRLSDVESTYVDTELSKANEASRSAKSEKEKALADVSVGILEALQTALKENQA